jgi:PAS domain S-box-containing protein
MANKKSLNNIPKYNKTEEALRESEERYRAVVESQSELICRWLPDGTLTFVNEAYCRYFNQTSDEMVGHSFIPLIPDEDREKVNKHFASINRDNPIATHEHRVIAPGGEIRWNQWTNQGFFDDRGNLIEFQSVGRDITKRKVAEEELKKSRQLLQKTFDTIPDAIISTDINLNIVSCNKSVKMIFGYTPDELIGKNYSNLLSDEMMNEAGQKRRQAELYEVGYLFGEENYFKRKNGEIFPGSYSVALIKDEKDKPTGMVGSISDITVRKRSEEEIRRLKNLSESIIDESPAIIEVVNRDLVVTAWNRYAEDYVNIKKEDIVGKKFFEVIPGLKKLGWDKIFKKVIETGEPYLAKDYKITRTFGPHKGETWYQDVRVAPLKEREKTTGAIVTINDITDRRKAEDALRESEERLREAQQFAHMGNWYWDLINNKEIWSQAMYDIYGVNQKNFKPKYENVMNAIHPEDRKPVAKVVEFALEKDKLIDVDFRIRRPDGTERIVNSKGKVFRDIKGNPIRMAGTCQDITDRKVAEEKLVESEDRFRGLIDVAFDGVTIYIGDRIADANESFARMFGYKVKEVIGRSAAEFTTPESFDLIKKNIRKGYEKQYEIVGVKKDGSTFDLEVLGKTCKYNGQEARVTALRDITERKKAEKAIKEFSAKLEDQVEERTKELQSARDSLLNMVEDITEAKKRLEEANKKLMEADRLKSVFLASMSHELRTPLNSIIGFTGIMLKGMAGELNEEQEKQVKIVYSNAKHLLNLIEDVLDISKIEAQRIEVSPEEFSLGSVVTEISESFDLEIKNKGLKLMKTVKDGKIYTDKKLFKQILMNLLSNAVKFTKKGSIEIEAFVENDYVKVSVKDTGVGIKKDDMFRLFEPFQRIGLMAEESKLGTGLGLYLSKKIAVHLGGDIRAWSSQKKGSVFTLGLPRKYKRNVDEKDTDNRGR